MAVLSDAQREAGWTIAKLGDIATLVMGTSPKSSDVVDYPIGIPLLNGPAEFTDKYPVPVKWTEKGIRFSEPGDILFCVRATLGKMNFSDRKYAIGRGLAAIRGIDELHTRYIYYTLLSTMESILRNANGTIYLSVTKSDVENFEIPLPPKDALKRIAGILGSLDDKIEANTRLIQTMDSYKSTLFQAHICSESEGETIKVSDVATLIRENIAASDIDESMNYVALEHIPRHSLYSHEWTNSEGVMSNKSGFKVGDILFGKLRPYFHKVSIAAVDGIASTDILVLRPKPGFEVLAQSVLSSEDLIEYATQVSSGTRMPRASWKDIMNYEVTVKNIEILQESLSGFETYSRALIHENKVLTETRDALIKRLIG